jgi:hypothetical protein
VEPSIIAVTEIKAKRQQSIEAVEYTLEGYTLFLNDNPVLGVALYMKNALDALECTEMNLLPFQESVWCTFTTKREERVLVGCVYKSPNSSDENIAYLHELLKHEELKRYDKVCITGDFNYPNVNWDGNWTSSKDEAFTECIRDAYLIQMVKKPTRRREGQQPTLIDLVLVNDESLVSDIVHCCPLGKSDHDILIFNLYVNEKEPEEKEMDKFDLGKGNYNAMRMEIGKIKWEELNDMNVEECWEKIRSTLSTSMNSHIPKVKKNGKKFKPKWLNGTIKKSVKKKHELFKKYMKSQQSYDYRQYLFYRNECNRVVKKAKRQYERKLAKECKENPKYFWRYVQSKTKSSTGISSLNNADGKLSVSDQEKADTLNSFFASVFTKENLDNVPETEEGSRSDGVLLPDIQVTPEAVKNKLKELNPTKAQGPDNIPPRVLKELSKELALPLSILFNKSLEAGTIPLDWKSAEVVAIFKKGTRSDPGNYRPVSLTCILCKVLESFVRDAIVSHMTELNLYSPCQHGFRKSRSCVTQLLEVMEILTDFLDEGDSVDLIYLDFKKAFDSVPHQRLLSKMSSYGISDKVHSWVRDFLCGRSQRVRVGSEFSGRADVLSGIPQGSILGPILFTIFINDITDDIQSCCRIFADDTKIFNRSSNNAKIQEDIELLQNWTQKWDLHFNMSKCHVLHMGKNNPHCSYAFSVNSQRVEINKCTEEKDLGVLFDEKLSFDGHIQSCIKKANRILGIIRRSFSFLDAEVLVRLYKALVRPHLEYANIIWSPHLKRQSAAIERVQRRATKLLPELRERTYEERMRALNLPSLKYRRYRGDLIQTFKILNKVDDLKFDEFYTFNDRCTRNADVKLHINRCSTNIKKYSFSFRSAKKWNRLSPWTRRAEDLNQFKNMLDVDKKREILEFDFD